MQFKVQFHKISIIGTKVETKDNLEESKLVK